MTFILQLQLRCIIHKRTMSTKKITITLELDMDFIPSEDIQKNIVLNVARILKEGGKNSGLVSSEFYPDDENETHHVVPFIDKLTAIGETDTIGLQYKVFVDLTNA